MKNKKKNNRKTSRGLNENENAESTIELKS